MEYTIPHYFEQFQCTAAKCEDTCCAGWAIMIDEDSLDRYQRVEGTFGNRLKNSVDWERGCFFQYGKRCAFLNEDNLCDMQIEAGEHMLCDTCRDYPRHMEEYEGLREGTLSLSCIEAAKLILGCVEPVQFIRFEDDVEDEEYEDFDYLLFTKLMDARERIIEILQTREVDIDTRIGLALDLTDRIQKAIKLREVYKIDDILVGIQGMEAFAFFENRVKEVQSEEFEYCGAMRKMFRVFSKLEVLKEDWPEYVKKAERILYGNGQQAYDIMGRKFAERFDVEGSIWMEQLMVYFVFTYFCGAVYDDNVLGKMKTAVVATLLTRELAFARWMEERERLTFAMFVDIAHRVSRELEHSDVNLVRLEKMCDTMPNLQTKELLRVVLH